jgi:hypothetical protein
MKFIDLIRYTCTQYLFGEMKYRGRAVTSLDMEKITRMATLETIKDAAYPCTDADTRRGVWRASRINYVHNGGAITFTINELIKDAQ